MDKSCTRISIKKYFCEDCRKKYQIDGLSNHNCVFNCCMRFLMEKVTYSQEIFQASANMTDVKLAIKRIEEVGSIDPFTETNIIANVLVFHLREMKEPLFGFSAYESIIKAGSVSDAESIRISDLRHILGQLPMEKIHQLQIIFRLLYRLITECSKYDATSSYLSGVFAPLLCKHRNSSYMSLRHVESVKQSRLVVQAMLDNYSEIFEKNTCIRCSELEISSNDDRKCIQSLIVLTTNNIFIQNTFISDIYIQGKQNISKSRHQLEQAKELIRLGYASWTREDRKKMVLSSRVLRLDIQRAERIRTYDYNSVKVTTDVFIKKAYEEYRYWKKLIRNSACLKIQSWYRGSMERKKLNARNKYFHTANYNDDYEMKELINEKKKLKQKLREFDRVYFDEYSSIPSKLEKESIRYLYERYNILKAIIKSKELIGTDIEPEIVQDFNQEKVGNNHSPIVQSLQREKRQLQTKLRSFEKEFREKHGRKVKYKADLAPIEQEYKKYKEVKAQLAECDIRCC